MQLHLHVSLALEPARIAIGVVLDSEATALPRRRDVATAASRRFWNPAIAQRVLAAISAELDT